MLVRFVGDTNGDGPQIMRLYGYAFELAGPPVEVAEDAYGAKLLGNRHFEVVGERPKLSIQKHAEMKFAKEVPDISTVKAPSKRRGRPPRGYNNQGSTT